MPKSRRIAFMLELERSYKHHAVAFAGAQQYASEHGWESHIDEYADDTLANCSAKSIPYDGVIARATPLLARQAERLRVPVVNVWYSSPIANQLPGVFADSAADGRLRAEHLLSRGLRRFAILNPRNNRWQHDSSQAFRQVVEAAGCSCVVCIIPLHFSMTLQRWRQTEQTLAQWMDQWETPIGVVVGSDPISRPIAQMCRERGWRIPDDVAILAGNNEELICEHLRPTLSSVEMGWERLGYAAAELLDRLIDEKEKGRSNGSKKQRAEQPRHLLLPPQGLVVRESTDFFAVDDPVIAAALEFISRDCHLPIQVQDVAIAVKLEPRTLQRRFRKLLDRTIADEIRRVRIERAKRQLTQSELTVTEVAQAVGFEDGHRLYEVFMRELGISPSQYRQERQGGGQR